MKLSPKSGYEFYGPNFKIITEYDVVPVPIDRGLWLDIVPTRDDYREHEMVRKCYYYDKVSHNGSYWLCSIVDGAHWVDGNGDYISDAAYSALTEAQKALCSRKQNYTIEEPSADSIDWTEVVKRGDKGDNMVRLDINNEMDMIPTTAALRIDTARTVETVVRLFDGATEVDISAATISVSGAETAYRKAPTNVTNQVQIYMRGDANGDGKVDAADIVETVNFKLGKPSVKFIMAAADMNGDNTIDETEILQIVNIILGAK
jgi:hypothetical protein